MFEVFIGIALVVIVILLFVLTMTLGTICADTNIMSLIMNDHIDDIGQCSGNCPCKEAKDSAKAELDLDLTEQ